ncbi:glycoside hydrolase family 97 protein [Bacteroides sp.]|uniref:glycoside hydrolase family 97 protein n=1 Tax=Bacteroides sp. TaxID=29523 RepID=UPI003AB300D3
MRNITIQTLCLLFICLGTARAQQYQLASPNGKLTVTVDVATDLTWKIDHDGTAVLQPSAIGMQGQDEMSAKKKITFGKNIKVTRAERKSVKTSFPTPIYKKAQVEDVYNELTLKCRGGYNVQFRAYDDGAAYRFISSQRGNIIVLNETADFNFAKAYKAFVPYVNDMRSGERYCYSFESYYDEIKLSQIATDSLAITPLLVDLEGGKRAVIMEAGLEDYPGMFLTVNPGTHQGLQAAFAPYPLEEMIGGHNRLNLVPTKRADYIARTTANRTFPWRVVLVTEKDTQLANNDMAQRLAPACRINDTSWIKPGKVAWDWWNTCNLTGVDFEAGMNTPTYKAFIDFAAANGLEYIIIDEGWSGEESLLEISPKINLEELLAYGKQKGVGIILWASWRNTAKEVEEVFSRYAQMGVKGFKIDFFDRDDQPLIQSVALIAECAAKHRLLLDLHGLKPYGIQRTYPNILNFEGVKGLENAKWEPIVNGAPLHNFPRYDVTAPYLRMLAGPMDYTPGAMMNATRGTFRAINDHPMSQGTRVHQMAMYTLFEAPLQMLADSPNKYQKEQECTDFIAQVPTTFDETVALAGEIGEYITLARRKGDTWYIASMTDWTPRDCTIDLSFLGDGNYEAEIFADGINAHREATDYKKEVRSVNSGDKLHVHMASGGGWTARIYKK